MRRITAGESFLGQIVMDLTALTVSQLRDRLAMCRERERRATRQWRPVLARERVLRAKLEKAALAVDDVEKALASLGVRHV